MLRFHADKFHALTTAVAVIRYRLKDGTIKGAPEPFIRKEFRERLDALGELLSVLGLSMSRKAVARTRSCFQDDLEFDLKNCTMCMDDLSSRIQDELEQSYILCLQSGAHEFYDPTEPLFGANVDEAFPSATYDISEAGKCFALGRSTACVMHTMRALEPALTTMARDLAIVLKRENWGQALNAIEKALTLAPMEKKEFLSEAAIQFRHFKDVWRNQAMHARIKYTPEEADVVLRAAKALMRHLAKQLKE